MYRNVEIKLEVLIKDPVAMSTTDRIVMSMLKLGEYFRAESGG